MPARNGHHAQAGRQFHAIYLNTIHACNIKIIKRKNFILLATAQWKRHQCCPFEKKHDEVCKCVLSIILQANLQVGVKKCMEVILPVSVLQEMFSDVSHKHNHAIDRRHLTTNNYI